MFVFSIFICKIASYYEKLSNFGSLKLLLQILDEIEAFLMCIPPKAGQIKAIILSKKRIVKQ